MNKENFKDIQMINSFGIENTSKTKKEYAEELRKLIKGLTKMHSKAFYDNYSSSEGMLEKIETILNQMENDVD